MKALSISQPWASAICSGIKDVENRQWKPAVVPGRILIHATSAKVPKYFENQPNDHISSVKNCRLMGQLSEYKEMPYGAIIGYVDCYDIVKDSPSYWAAPESLHWCLRNAFLFDEPIPGVKGVQGHLFDFDIDGDQMPAAHKAEVQVPVIKDKNLTMPASDEVFKQVEAGEKEIFYDFDIIFFNIFVDPKKNEIIQPKKVRFVCGGKTVEKSIKAIEVGPYTDEKGKEVTYTGFDGGEVPWQFLAIVLE